MTVPRSQQGRSGRFNHVVHSPLRTVSFPCSCTRSRSQLSKQDLGRTMGLLPSQAAAGIKLQCGGILSWVTSQPVLAADTAEYHKTFLELLFCKNTLGKLCLEPLHGSPTALPIATSHKVISL